MNKICRKCHSTTTNPAIISNSGNGKGLQERYPSSIYCMNCQELELLTEKGYLAHD